MVWGALAYNTRSLLVLIRGTMTAQRYVHDILQPHEFPLIQRLPKAIFQPDNAGLHTAKVSQDCLHTVTILPWPARSPDLSPIEHIWDHLGCHICLSGGILLGMTNQRHSPLFCNPVSCRPVIVYFRLVLAGIFIYPSSVGS
ncbi:transposable element Tcb2 transposase [Trichonephila clavipes]|nr:transposable element Tcb2 transposase [Trichonephila clavipes]